MTITRDLEIPKTSLDVTGNKLLQRCKKCTYEMIRVSHVAGCPMVVIFCIVIFASMEKYSNLQKLVSFKDFQPLWFASSRFCAGPDENYTVLHNNCESMYYNCVPNGFCFSLWSSSLAGMLKLMRTPQF